MNYVLTMVVKLKNQRDTPAYVRHAMEHRARVQRVDTDEGLVWLIFRDVQDTLFNHPMVDFATPEKFYSTC